MTIDYKKEGRIAIITINRPERRNALDAETRQQLIEAMRNFGDDTELWVGIITGAGDKAFCAGADIGGPPPGPSGGIRPADMSMEVFNLADTIWKPFIAAINGYALGGGLEIALTCDIRIAAENARLGLPEPLIGASSTGEGKQRLARFIPRAIASWMMITGQQIDAQEAYRIGLVNKVVPLAQLMPTAMEMAETVCQAAPMSSRVSKEMIIRGWDTPLERGAQLQRDVRSRHVGTEDRIEGNKAFAEKRKPVWKGK